MPLASGQSLAIPDASSKGETGLSNKKWSYITKQECHYFLYMQVYMHVYIDKLILLCFCHLRKRIILSCKFSTKIREGIDHNLYTRHHQIDIICNDTTDPFNFTSLSTGTSRRQTEATDTTASANTSGEHILFIKQSSSELQGKIVMAV